MRTSSPLDSIISRPVQQVLSAILLGNGEPVYLSDLANRLDRTPSTLQRPLDALVRAGILARSSDGNRVYYAADAECPILTELREMLRKTVGVVEVVREALREYESLIQVALIYGSMARSAELAQSDVDLLVIGDVTLAQATPALRQMEHMLGRPVNAACFAVEEFREKVDAANPYLNSLLASEKLFVLGGQYELDAILTKRSTRAGRDDERRSR